MNQSSAPRASTVVKTAALLMAVPVLLAPMKLAAQQMAANTPDFARCDRLSQSNPKAAISCRVEVLNTSAAAAEVRVADANVLGKCLDFLKAQKAAGKSFDRPITRDNACMPIPFPHGKPGNLVRNQRARRLASQSEKLATSH